MKAAQAKRGDLQTHVCGECVCVCYERLCVCVCLY